MLIEVQDLEVEIEVEVELDEVEKEDKSLAIEDQEVLPKESK